MNSVWLIVERGTEVSGHGESADTLKLAGPKAYNCENTFPAFVDRGLAERFLEAVNSWGFYSLKEIPLMTQGQPSNA